LDQLQRHEPTHQTYGEGSRYSQRARDAVDGAPELLVLTVVEVLESVLEANSL
jgi:hypothetical protein